MGAMVVTVALFFDNPVGKTPTALKYFLYKGWRVFTMEEVQKIKK
jgi:hypothetical protein